MKQQLKKKLNKVIIIAVWLLIWQAAASLTGLELILASPVNVFRALCSKINDREFYMSVCGSVLHIFAGFLVGFVTACAAGTAAASFKRVKEFLRPAIVTMQSLPVASFIIIVIIWFGSKNVASYISFVVVFPMIYNGVITGIENVDAKILEMAEVFRVPKLRQIRCIYAAYVLPYVKTSLKSALGMCWKAGVSAEVIGLAANSIGEQLYYSKLYLMTADLFAWSIVVVIISFVFEKMFIRFVDFAVQKMRKL